jgi:parvulin-like peptidyl-prolyl isomerase
MKRHLNSYLIALTAAIVLNTTHASEPNSCITLALDNNEADYSAQVNQHHIGTDEYIATLQITAKNRFYHAAAPEGNTEEFRDEIIELLINERLLSDYAVFNEGLYLSDEKLALKNMELDEMLADSDLTQDQINNIKQFFLCQFERAELTAMLKELVHERTTISTLDVEDFYTTFPEKFTSPVRNRLGLILIGVDPSANSDAWVTAKGQADAIYFQLKEGADFATLAKNNSSDISARDGGDMGYQHKGMLGDGIEAQADILSPGEFTEPLYLLEGWAIVKLIEQIEPGLNPLESVKERAYSLTLRETKDMNWQNLISDLRQSSKITYFLK